MPIDFIEVEILNKGCTSELQKMKNSIFLKNLMFLALEPKILIF